MDEKVTVQDTPVATSAQDTPATEPTKTPSPRAGRAIADPDDALIAADLSGGVDDAPQGPEPKPEAKPKAKPEAKAAEASDDTSESEEDPEHPDAERMMRADYLKKLNQLKKEKEELEAARREFEAQLQTKQGPKTGAEAGDEDDGEADQATTGKPNPFSFLAEDPVDGLDPEDFDDDVDVYMAGVVKGVGEQLNQMKRLLAVLLQERAKTAEVARQQHAEMAVRIMSDGAAMVEKRFGIRPSEDEIGQAILDYGEKVVAASGGVLTAETALECWKRANVDLILGSVQKPESTPSVPETTPTAARGASSLKTDEEKMLQDLIGSMG